jgi:hypothetical protein
MNGTQKGIIWAALAVIAALLLFAPFTYTAENALAAAFGESRPGSAGKFHAPIWTSADDAAASRVSASESAGVMQVSGAQLDAGRLGIYLGIVIILAGAGIALTASKKADGPA